MTNLLRAISPEFQAGQQRRRETDALNRLNELKIQEAELRIQDAKNKSLELPAMRESEKRQQATEEEIKQVQIGNKIAKNLLEIADTEQRAEVFSRQIPTLRQFGFDEEDLGALYDPDPQIWEQKLQTTIQSSNAFIERELTKLSSGQSLVDESGNIVTTAPFRPNKPSAIESKLIAEGLQPGTAEFQQRAKELNSKSGVNINLGDQVKAPPSTMFIDPSDPRKGVRPIPGSQLAIEQAQAEASLEKDLQAFESLIQDRNFSGAVGPIDQFTARIGALFRTKEGVINSRARRLIKTGVVAIAKSLGANPTDKDIELLLQTQPSTADQPEIWQDWYENQLLPTIQARQAGLSRKQLIQNKQSQDFDFEYDPATGTFK